MILFFTNLKIANTTSTMTAIYNVQRSIFEGRPVKETIKLMHGLEQKNIIHVLEAAFDCINFELFYKVIDLADQKTLLDLIYHQFRRTYLCHHSESIYEKLLTLLKDTIIRTNGIDGRVRLNYVMFVRDRQILHTYIFGSQRNFHTILTYYFYRRKHLRYINQITHALIDGPNIELTPEEIFDIQSFSSLHHINALCKNPLAWIFIALITNTRIKFNHNYIRLLQRLIAELHIRLSPTDFTTLMELAKKEYIELMPGFIVNIPHNVKRVEITISLLLS